MRLGEQPRCSATSDVTRTPGKTNPQRHTHGMSLSAGSLRGVSNIRCRRDSAAKGSS